ncbi:MAG: hypothetical protein PHD20_02940 [Clostridia bacterium]|nr:hypothetical protein [Clostridia bacterium]
MLNINNYKPITKNITIKYFVEYTNELERDPDFTNIHQLPRIKGLEDAIQRMFLLRKQNKHNIAIGYEITDNSDNKIIIADDIYNLECYTDTNEEDKLLDKISKQSELITELAKENELMKSFLLKYNALDRFNKEMKGW